jgi:chemotaxis protein methyltransferase WspC
MALESIKLLLKDKIGLNASTVGSSNFERAVRQRMNTCQIEEVDAYFMLVRSSDVELKELIEEVVVPETWFFRNQISFIALEEYIKKEWLEEKSKKTLRFLSVPCSTGEEPVSIVVTLDRLGMRPDAYHVDAVDISTRTLVKAKRGVYGRHSFRNKENAFKEIYFDVVGEHFVLQDRIKNAIHYQQGNLLDKYFGTGRKRYDIIFCRNLLIYFDRPTQEQAMEKLSRLLTNDGILFLGHAETGEYINKFFKRADYPKAFAYRKKKPDEQSAKPVFDIKKERPAPRPATATNQVQGTEFLETVEFRFSQDLPPRDNKVLREVTRLANAGQLKEAGALCEDYLRDHATSAQAYYLLGLIREAEGKFQLVGDLFRKSLDLDPNHHEAMIHLALNAAREGDKETAKNLHERAQRVLKGRKSE